MTTLKAGTLLDCIIPPAMGDDAALRGHRPAVLVGTDPLLGLLVLPVTTAETARSRHAPYIDERGVYGHVRVDSPRWIGEPCVLRRYEAPLTEPTTRRVLEAARERLIGVGQRDLYRAAKRQLGRPQMQAR